MNGVERSLLMVGFSCLMTAGCGKKGPLIYPDMLVPAAPAAATGGQSGRAVKLQFALPDKDRAGRPVTGVAGVRISRKVSETGGNDVCRSCMTDYLPLRTLYLDHLPTDTQRFGNGMVLLDSDVRVGGTYSYVIVPFTVDGVDGASAPVADVRVVPPIVGPELKVESLPTEMQIRLSLQPPGVGRLVGYNLYRSPVTAARSYLPLNRQPLKDGVFIDSGLKRGVSYRYSARALVALPNGEVVESLESPEVEGMLKEDE